MCFNKSSETKVRAHCIARHCNVLDCRRFRRRLEWGLTVGKLSYTFVEIDAASKSKRLKVFVCIGMPYIVYDIVYGGYVGYVHVRHCIQACWFLPHKLCGHAFRAVRFCCPANSKSIEYTYHPPVHIENH